jgi:antitoxin FitA
MTSILIRDVPDDTLSTLKARAKQASKSLQAYIRDMLNRQTRVWSMEEAVAEAKKTASLNAENKVTVEDILAAIDEGRAGR